jgi:hypothetical protein
VAGCGGPPSGVAGPNKPLVRFGSRFMSCNTIADGGRELLPPVPSGAFYHGRQWCLKPVGQRSLGRKAGRESASRHGDCQHRGGRGPGLGGTVNPGEASLNVVT